MGVMFLSKRIHRVLIGAVSVVCSLAILSEFAYLPANADEEIVVDMVAHRGYSAQYPENTLSAFEGARAAGAKTIEFDVRKSADGQLVISHDDTLVKASGDETPIAELNYSDLAQIDVGSWFGTEFAGEQLPTLDMTLRFLCRNPGLKAFVELKDVGEDPDFAAEVYNKCSEYGVLNRVIFISFNYNYLMQIKELNPSQPIMVLASFGKSNLPQVKPAEYYGINMKTITPQTIAAIHAAGSKVYVYPPLTRGQVLSLQRLGIDGVISDVADKEVLQ